MRGMGYGVGKRNVPLILNFLTGAKSDYALGPHSVMKSDLAGEIWNYPSTRMSARKETNPRITNPMKKPLTDRMHYLQHLISQVLEDMEYLMDTYSEEEAKPYVFMLIELSQGYRASLKALGERLEAQNGWDFEI